MLPPLIVTPTGTVTPKNTERDKFGWPTDPGQFGPGSYDPMGFWDFHPDFNPLVPDDPYEGNLPGGKTGSGPTGYTPTPEDQYKSDRALSWRVKCIFKEYMKVNSWLPPGEFADDEKKFWSVFFGENSTSPYLSERAEQLHKQWAELNTLLDLLTGRRIPNNDEEEATRKLWDIMIFNFDIIAEYVAKGYNLDTIESILKGIILKDWIDLSEGAWKAFKDLYLQLFVQHFSAFLEYAKKSRMYEDFSRFKKGKLDTDEEEKQFLIAIFAPPGSEPDDYDYYKSIINILKEFSDATYYEMVGEVDKTWKKNPEYIDSVDNTNFCQEWDAKGRAKLASRRNETRNSLSTSAGGAPATLRSPENTQISRGSIDHFMSPFGD